MDTQDHVYKSLHHLNYKDPKFFKENWDKISPLIWELHYWLDYFAGMPGYQELSVIYHKEQRHHWEGIQEAVKKFIAKFGQEFEQIILAEAEIHVSDDFCGDIPSKDECTHRYIREKQKELALSAPD